MLNKPLSKLFFTAFDFETTGLYPQNDKIVEIGAVKFNIEGEQYLFSGLINPKIQIPFGASKVNGITDEMIIDKPFIEDILPGFTNFISDTVLIAHNIAFDAAFLINALEICNIEINDMLCLDTIILSKKYFPGLYSYSLGNISKYLDIEIKNAHRAEDDAEACMRIFKACLNKISNYKDLTLEEFLKNTGISKKKLYKNYNNRK